MIPWEERTDEELVQIVQSPSRQKSLGDDERSTSAAREAEDALEELLKRNYDWVVRVCLVAFANAPLGLDCAQETMIRVAKSIGRFEGRSKLSTWIYVILRRTVSEFRRKGLSYQQNVEQLKREDKDLLGAADEVCAETVLVNSEEQQLLMKHLQQLPNKQREAVILHYFEDLPVSDVASRMSVSVSSVKTHLRRGREGLRKLLGKEDNR